MGGQGSGRPPSEETIINRMKESEPKTPIGTDLFLPNLSGDHSAGHTGTPISDLDIANKKYVDDAVAGVGGYTDEQAQDAIGTILTDTATIDFIYDDATPKITADIKPTGISHTGIVDIGTNTHAQIDTAITNSTNHIADNTQAHSDYLLNNESDITSGMLTAAGFITAGTISGAAIVATGTISGATIIGSNVTSGTNPGHTHTGGSATKEFFIVPTDPLADTQLGDFTYDILGSSISSHFNLYVPADFSSLTECAIVMIPDTTETIQYDIECSVAAVGEDYNASTNAGVNQTQAVTINDLTEVSIKDMFGVANPLTAGDYVGIKFTSNIASLRIIGLRFKYA